MTWFAVSYRTAIVGTLAAALAVPAKPVEARPRIGGAIVGGIIAGAVLGTVLNGPRKARANVDRRNPKDRSNDDQRPVVDNQPVIMARGTTDVVFKGIIVSKGLGAVGVEDGIDTSRQDVVRDKARDYTSAIDQILTTITDAVKSTTRNGIAPMSQGDVTKHALDRAVTVSYDASRLNTFEQFVGEQWTNERLKVAIVSLANAEVPQLLLGNNNSRVEMSPLNDIIQRAGRNVYKRTLEMSELIAMNQATARFMRVMFETHGPVQTDDMRIAMEDILHAGSSAAFAEYSERFQRSEFGVVLRYRAERVLVDCLTANVEKLVGGRSKTVSKQAVIDKISEFSRSECRGWIVKAIGDPKTGTAETDEKILKPLPVRAVWIDGEAKTDASMFGQPSRL